MEETMMTKKYYMWISDVRRGKVVLSFFCPNNMVCYNGYCFTA